VFTECLNGNFDLICHHVEVSLCLIAALLLHVGVVNFDHYLEVLASVDDMLLGNDFSTGYRLLLLNLRQHSLVKLASILRRIQPIMLS
jgi:hypothetical protein